MAVQEISSEFISSELTRLNMNDSNLGHFSITRLFNDRNMIFLPTQNLLRAGRSFRTRCSKRGNTFGMISSSPKSSMSSISSITLQSSMKRSLSWTIIVVVEEDNRCFKFPEPFTFKWRKFWNLDSVCMFVDLKEEVGQCWLGSNISSDCTEDSSNLSKLGNTIYKNN